jgi:hypothetical protein
MLKQNNGKLSSAFEVLLGSVFHALRLGYINLFYRGLGQFQFSAWLIYEHNTSNGKILAEKLKLRGQVCKYNRRRLLELYYTYGVHLFYEHSDES